MIRRRTAVVLAWTAVAAAMAVAGCASSSQNTPSGQGTPAIPGTPGAPGTPTSQGGAPGGGGTAAAPTNWQLPADPAAAVARAGLPMLGHEELAVHYHAHLDILVDGQRVTVPALIGIDERRQQISPLHTHDTSGVIHIESATNAPFTLGQLFAEWGQPLSRSQVGPLRIGGDRVFRLYRNGQEVSGDAGTLVFRPHLEIALWVGAKSATPQVPASYSFPANL
jgi:hypothetical protein